MTTNPGESEIDRLSRELHLQRNANSPKHFDYRDIKDDLESIVQPLLTLIGTAKASWLQSYEKGLVHVLALTVVVNRGTWESIRFQSSERPEAGWNPEFLYAVPALARTILDALFNTVFLFDNLAENAHWFLASGWCDQKNTYARFKKRYGTDPEWALWLQAAAADIHQTEEHLVQLSNDEKQPDDDGDFVPRRGFWPNPGKMGFVDPKVKKVNPKRDYSMKDPTRTGFLEYVNDWFYRRLSGDSHLHLTGLLARGGHHLSLAAGPSPQDMYLAAKAEFVLTALTIYVALLSEIAIELNAPEKARLRTIWLKLVTWPDAEDLYNKRYHALLA